VVPTEAEDDDGTGTLCNGEPGCTDNEGVVWSWGGSGAIGAVSEAALPGFVVGTIPPPTNDGVPVPAVFAIAASSDRERRADGVAAPFPFAVDAATGTITVAAGGKLDYEASPWVNFTVLITEADAAQPPFVLSASLAIPISASYCVAGTTWSVTGTSPCEPVKGECVAPFVELTPPSASADRQCGMLGADESTDGKDKNAKAGSSTAAMVSALLVGLVVLVLVIGALVRRRQQREEVDAKDASAGVTHSATNPAFVREGEYGEVGPGGRDKLDPEYALFGNSGAAHSDDDDDDDEATYDMAAGATKANGGAEATYDMAAGVAKASGLEDDAEATYDMAAGVAKASGLEDDAEATYDVASNIKPEATYDTATPAGWVRGEGAVYDTAAAAGGDGGGGRSAEVEEELYARALAGLLDDSEDSENNVYCAASAFYTDDGEEAVYDHAANMPVRTHAAGAEDETCYDVGAAVEPLYAVGSDGGVTELDGAEEPLYALGTTGERDEATCDLRSSPTFALGNNRPSFELATKALLEGLGQADQAMHAVGATTERGAVNLAHLEEEAEEDDATVAMDAGYVGCGGAADGRTAGSLRSSGSSSSSFFEDSAFVVTGDGKSVRLASVRRSNPLFGQATAADPALVSIGETASHVEEDA
jgi:hypothetical protein